jgi:hypothetical protein
MKKPVWQDKDKGNTAGMAENYVPLKGIIT